MKRNARLGLRFFVVYAALYLAFVLLNAFAPQTMERISFAGVNLAVTSGMGLIVFAFVLSLVYGVMCNPDDQGNEGDRGGRS